MLFSSIKKNQLKCFFYKKKREGKGVGRLEGFVKKKVTSPLLFNLFIDLTKVKRVITLDF
jgi:hypothetical protein